LSEIEVIKIDNDMLALLQLPDDTQQQSQVLKTLLALNLPVCEFAPTASNLQDAYLQTIKQRP
jgi:ABC-2 type transport system ATP-binding protein